MRKGSAVALGFLAGFAAGILLVVFGWRPLQLVLDRLRPLTPRQRYARALENAGLAHSALGVEWLSAAARALEDPMTAAPAYEFDAVLDPGRPAALALSLRLEDGQRLDVRVTIAPDAQGCVFVDLFRRSTRAQEPHAIESAPENSSSLSYEASAADTYVVRVQPELLAEGRLHVAVTAGPSLMFPVAGRGARDMQSGFGDPRDAARRRHEGVDFFAPRGTPVLSASDGFVMQVGENRLGGRVVWVWDMARALRLYYAHLQDQSVRAGRFVHEGDRIGTVGNTGNARTAPPHLHFGIYRRGEGAVDPDGFIRPQPALPHR